MRLTTKPFLCVMALGAVMLLVADAKAASVSWALAGTGDYADSANWNTATVPVSGDKMTVGNGGTAVIDTPQALDLSDFRINKDSTLEINPGGSVGSLGWSFLGKSGSFGTDGTLNMNGGFVHIFNPGPSAPSFIVGRESHGILNMNSGFIFVEGNFKIDDKAFDGGEVHLHGGNILASGFDMDKGGAGGNSATMDITNGTMTIVGDIEAYIDTQIGSGILTGFGGTGTVLRNYDAVTGLTTVWAVPEPTSIALLGMAGSLLALVRRW